METIYLNTKTPQGVETVDQFTRGKDAPEDPKEFRKHLREMIKEYSMSGINVYSSSRCTREWKNK
jgi:hypothetical protein